MMDISLTRHSVKVEDSALCGALEIETEGVADLSRKKEPKKLLKISGKTVITSKYVTDKTMTVEGTATACIIYLDTSNCLCSHEHTMFFSKTAQIEGDLSGAEAEISVREDRYTAGITADNSFKLGAVISLDYCIKKMSSKEIICDIDEKSIEQLSCKLESTVPLGKGEKNLVVEEEVSIGNGQPSVDCVIRSNAEAFVEECKTVGGKVMIKGKIKLYVLYLSKEGTRPQSFEESFPFSQLVDVDGVYDDCKCDSEVKILFCELTPRVSADDDIRSFSVALKLSVKVKAYCDDEIPAVVDAYSTQGGYSFERNCFAFKKLRERFCDRFIAKKNLEFTDGAIGSVIDMWCETKSSAARFEDGSLKISGTMLVNILAFDCEGVPDCYERPIDFEYAYTPEIQYSAPEVTYDITLAHCSYTIVGANTVAVAVEPQVCITLYDNVKYELLTAVAEDKNACCNTAGKSSIVLYFAQEGETLWDIARRYNSSVSEIKTLNGVNEDVLTSSKKFIIPTK